MKRFGSEIVGKEFRTGDVAFTVLEIESYPAKKVSPRYEDILAFKPGVLVAVGHRGTCIPNITLKGGVARLTKVKVGDKVLNRPKDISDALGIKHPMIPHVL